LAPRQGQPALRILLRARKTGRAAFRLLAPLVIHTGDAHDGDRESYTAQAQAVLRDAADLSAMFR
jgi:tRNA1(Val) A37 N6-methylase TrmN6